MKTRGIKDLTSIFGFPSENVETIDKRSTMGQISGFIKNITYPPTVAAWFGEESMSYRAMYLTCVGHFPKQDTVTRKWRMDDSQVKILGVLAEAACSFPAAQNLRNHSETVLVKSLLDLLAYAYF